MHYILGLMHHWFQAHLDIILLAYGLAFWTLGVVIGIWPRKESKFKLGNILWLLGGFGLAHGINEFLGMIEAMSSLSPGLQTIHRLALIISYFFLFEFGRQFLLICKEDEPKKVAVLFGRRLTFGIGFVIIALSLMLGDFLKTASMLARYFLCFPGGLLAAVSFVLYYRRQEDILAPREIKRYFFLASIFFLAYGILGGLIVPKTSLFPSNFLNTEAFFSALHIPIQVLRAVCAIGIIFTVIAILRIFNWETEDLFKKAYDNLEALVHDRTKDLISANQLLKAEVVERKRMEEEAHRIGERFQDITVSTEEWIWEVDAQGRYIYSSAASEKMLGYKPEEIIGKYFYDFFYSEDREELKRLATEVFSKRETFKNFPNRNLTKDGRILILETSAVPILGENGVLSGYRGVDRDITERKKAEEKLKKAEELYRTLIENIDLGITLIDKDHNIIMTSSAFGRLFKKDPKEFFGLKCYKEFEKRACVCPGCPGEKTLATGKPAEEYRKGVLDDGSSFEARVSTFPVFDSDGTVSSFIEVVENITEHRKREEELKWKTAFLESQVEASIDGILVVDKQGQIILANKRLLELWNIPEHIRNDKNDESLLQYVVSRTKTPAQFLDKVKYLYSHQNETSRDEIEFKDGIIFDRYSSPVRDKDGTYFGRIWIFRDITDRKKKEEELKTAYEQLKAAQAQLVQSAKMASIGLLAGGVAHEINNPLTGVLNNVQLIKMMASQKKSFKLGDFKELLDVVEESAQRCTKITRSLLGFSRASKGIVQEISLNDMIEKVAGLLEDELVTQNIGIHKELDSRLPLVKGDSQLLQQVVFDIITNARWAIKQKPEHRGGTITIKTAYKAEDKCVSISISDTGIGIPKENVGKIFEPFFTTKPIGEGTGLGLSIVYNIIKEHSGTITVESEAGKGTIFKICLPAILS